MSPDMRRTAAAIVESTDVRARREIDMWCPGARPVAGSAPAECGSADDLRRDGAL
eukprot:CAMPEP_0176127724 /NCGR_PEP_ID=MMETSP0120_2-20121206/64519_1 /TAXON_ID=160619 /ORGANISM="Kryptoperidinium foliaceum, Strain CCMP 1326" /LENGTH=54 /DNA_ID=CAMNT_0017462771 /DNA_START=23 /DNA_END=185 /DNA_ORIENTATION=+